MAASVGYCGGWTDNPSYRTVCSGRTGHAEVVQLEFDSSVVSLGAILRLFWKMHNPSASWRTDPHSQYRSAIFASSEEQLKVALASKGEHEAAHGAVSTEVRPAGPYWVAEDYHQQYYEKRGLAAACPL